MSSTSPRASSAKGEAATRGRLLVAPFAIHHLRAVVGTAPVPVGRVHAALATAAPTHLRAATVSHALSRRRPKRMPKHVSRHASKPVPKHVRDNHEQLGSAFASFSGCMCGIDRCTRPVDRTRPLQPFEQTLVDSLPDPCSLPITQARPAGHGSCRCTRAPAASLPRGSRCAGRRRSPSTRPDPVSSDARAVIGERAWEAAVQ